MDAATKITKARTRLLLDNVFFSTLALKLTPVATTRIETLGTDGVQLLYNAEFVDSLPIGQLMGVICHEVLHCAMLHHTRRNDREVSKWQRACDYAINPLLLDDFQMELPPDRLYDAQYKGMSVDEIYTKLEDTDDGDNAECPWGSIGDADEDDRAGTVQEQETEWTISSKAAAEMARSVGKLPGGLGQLIEKAQAMVNWREQLARLLSSQSKTDFSWFPPDIQYIQYGLHIPTLNSPSLGNLTFAIDTSASVNDYELGQFVGELQDILDHLAFESLTIIHCDTEIKHISTLEPGDDLTCEVHGRGGTRFEPVFEYCEEHPTDALIYFTDMEPWEWPEEPEYPVFWGRTQDKDAPYGQHIDVFRG